VGSAAGYLRTASSGFVADGIVGRDSDLVVLRALLDRLFVGDGAVVLIGGVSGIGKTALVDVLRSEAAGLDAQILMGACYDLMDTPPYGPWLEVAASTGVTNLGTVLRQLLTRPERDGAGSSQAAFFSAVRDCFANVARGRPTVVILEDLHWADSASVELLRGFSRHAVALPMLLVATYRTEDVAGHDGLYATLPLIVREARATRIDLRPLEDQDVGMLVRSRYALPSSDQVRLVSYLQVRAQGNPFFLHELLRELQVEQVLRADTSAETIWRLGPLEAIPLPKVVQQVLTRRLERFAEEDRQHLALAAVIGQEVPLELWSEVAAMTEQELLDLVERVVSAYLMIMPRDGTAVRFAHALVRETLYEGLLPARRRIWHREIADVLLTHASPDPDAIAYHLRQAGDRRAGVWLIRSAERAQGAYAWLTAAERYETALAELDESDATAATRARLLVLLSQLRRYTDPEWGISRLRDAERLASIAGNQALAAAAQFDRGHLRCMGRDFEGGLEDMRTGLAGLEALSPGEREDIPGLDVLEVRPGERQFYHRGVLVLFLAVLGRLAEAGAGSSATDSPSAGMTAREWLGRGWRSAALGEAEPALQAFAQARAVYADQHWEIGTTYFFELDLVVLPFQTARLLERRRLANEAEAAWKRARGALLDLDPRLAQLPLLYLEGRWTEARDVAQTTLAALRSNDAWRRYPGRFLATIAREQDEPDLAWQLVREEFPGGPATAPGGTWFLPGLELQRLAASLALDVGDLPLARKWLEAHERWLDWSGAVRGRAEGYLAWSVWSSASGDSRLAQRYAQRACTEATQTPQPLALLGAHRILGELATAAGNLDTANIHLDTALGIAEACGAVHARALTLLALASLRHAQSRQPEVDTLVAEVRAICEALGARRMLAHARLLGQKSAMRTPRTVDPDPLTGREVEVLTLIATGISNQEIAERLVLSVRTVERHINSLYRKIEARGRADAVAYAARRGLLRQSD
jgi:DNA-binding CsgD family transcriptional regulator